MTKIAVALMADQSIDGVGQSVSELGIDDLVALEPRAYELLEQIRGEIGTKIKAEREAVGLSLEEVRDMTGRAIDSAGLSRLERGRAWSAELVATARKLYARERGKQERADARKAAKAGK